MKKPAGGAAPSPPGPKGQRLRNLRERTSDFSGFANRLRHEYGDVVSFELPFMKCCIVFDTELIREVLVTQQSYFRPWFPGDLTDDFKYGSITLRPGEEHRRRSEFMASAFAGDSEGTYAAIIAEKALLLRDRLLSLKSSEQGSEQGADGGADGGADLVKEFERFAWDAVVGIVLGPDVQLPRRLGEEVLDLQKMYLMLDIAPGPRLLKSLPLPTLRRGRKSVGLVDDAIYTAMRKARDSGYARNDIVAKYVQARDVDGAAGGLDTDRAIRDELIILLTAFIDAPTSALTFGVHYLAANPDVRRKVEREADTVLNGGNIDEAAFDRLPYTGAVLDEVLRIDPPTAVMLPKEATEDRVLGGYRIPEGTLVHVAMRALHHAPGHWDRASDFRPERWLENPPPPCPAHAYIPFGLGPHFCQGMDIAKRIVVFALAALAGRLRLEPRSTEPPNRNDTAVGVAGPWTADVRERHD
ncbi:MAG: cytochrome P450 [Gemmatimonadales bacterium]|nr:cytochrome P450 [Gemmatimonadales bacterium]